MKNKTEENKKLNTFTPENVERLNMLAQKIQELKEKSTITEQTVKELDNLISELLILRSGLAENLLNWTKQGYLLEQ